MQSRQEKEIGTTLFYLDVLVTIITFLTAFWIRDYFDLADQEVNFYSHVFIIPLLLFLVTGPLSYFGGYREPYHSTLTGYAWAIIRAIIVAVGSLLALLFLLKIQYVSRAVILLFASIEIGALLLVRVAVVGYYREKMKSGRNKPHILIVGTRTRARELVSALKEHIAWGVEIIGFVDPDPTCLGKEIDRIPVIGTVENIHECLKNNIVDEVIIAIPRSLLSDAEPIVTACEEEGIRLRFMADLFNIKAARISLTQMKDIPILTLEPVAQDHQQLLAKRFFDLVLTLTALPFLVPLFALVAVAIKLDSRGPVFFVQERVGFRKHKFRMYKFRSMYVDAEDRLKEIEHLNEADGPIFKMKNDPRLTRVGRIIRKTSIDELPQLINVLRNEMSLVGPRPMSIRDVELFDKGIQRKRFSVQPGLTCIWQVSGRSNLSFERWLELDLEYIENWSFWLDVKIMLRTIPAVINSRGAA